MTDDRIKKLIDQDVPIRIRVMNHEAETNKSLRNDELAQLGIPLVSMNGGQIDQEARRELINWCMTNCGFSNYIMASTSIVFSNTELVTKFMLKWANK